MRLSEIRGEAALDLLADIMEPASEILADEEFKKAAQGGTLAKLAAVSIKRHKKAVIEILARLDDEDPETYAVNVFTLPKKLIEILSDRELRELFTSAGQTTDSASSGSPTAIIADGGQ